MADNAALAVEKKNEGNAHFKAKRYAEAIAAYTEAVNLDPANHVFYSNRSAAYLGWGKFQEAAEDGQRCIDANRDFVKGYFRRAKALKELGQYSEALTVLQAGLRVDFNHADLTALLNEVRPMAEQEEADRRSGMSRAERIKLEGNDLFKAGQFDAAITKYGEAIDACASRADPVAVACLNNRAACHHQQYNFDAVISDTTEVLEAQPENIKALTRRALAFEAIERYRSSLADIRYGLQLNPNNDVLNKAQHRVGAAVRRLKSGENMG